MIWNWNSCLHCARFIIFRVISPVPLTCFIVIVANLFFFFFFSFIKPSSHKHHEILPPIGQKKNSCSTSFIFFQCFSFFFASSSWFKYMQRKPWASTMVSLWVHALCVATVSQWSQTDGREQKNKKKEETVDQINWRKIICIIIGDLHRTMIKMLMKYSVRLFLEWILCYCTHRCVDHRYTSTTQCLRI